MAEVLHEFRSTGANQATRNQIWWSRLTLGESRRAWNRDRIGLLTDLLCECTRPSCRETVPALAEAHRRMADQFAVAPAHLDGGIVVRVADRFFVIELPRAVR